VSEHRTNFQKPLRQAVEHHWISVGEYTKSVGVVVLGSLSEQCSPFWLRRK